MESECIIKARGWERETSGLMARRQRKNEKKLFFFFFLGVMCQGVNPPAQQTEEAVPDAHEQLWRSEDV